MAQPGSAPEWGSGGREFESRRPDQLITKHLQVIALHQPGFMGFLFWATFGLFSASLGHFRRCLYKLDEGNYFKVIEPNSSCQSSERAII